MSNLILCGLPGSGKTTAGKLLAEKLSRPYIDTDRLIEEHHQLQFRTFLSCREIALNKGILFFRSLEEAVIEQLSDIKNHIIATGGGVLLSSQNTQRLKTIGKVIYLEANPEKILPRILSKGIPSYLDARDPLGSFKRIAQERKGIYEKAADITLNTDQLSANDVAMALLRMLS